MKEKVTLIKTSPAMAMDKGLYTYFALVAFHDGNQQMLVVGAPSPNGLPFRDGAELELTYINTPEGNIITKITCTMEVSFPEEIAL